MPLGNSYQCSIPTCERKTAHTLPNNIFYCDDHYQFYILKLRIDDLQKSINLIYDFIRRERREKLHGETG